MSNKEWYEIEEDNEDKYEIKIYDITPSPNDFNINTYFDFIEAGKLIIPTFQRNYVWDIKKASKLIESLIIGLPIPQIFLFSEGDNRYIVIDGQQRLMSIYYFIKGRFPRTDKRAEIRRKLIEKDGVIDDDFMQNNDYYRDFKLSMDNKKNPLNNETYDSLDENLLDNFKYRTIRNISIRQNSPHTDENSSIYEIFNRLNTGGINLQPQEIRSSLYHSSFYDMLQKINLNTKWREFLGKEDLDLHLKDIEILLRVYALGLSDINTDYKSNMKSFLNEFSSKAKKFTDEQIEKFKEIFFKFMESCKDLEQNSFMNSKKRFQISIFDAVFYVWIKEYLNQNTFYIDKSKFNSMREDIDFKKQTEKSTTNTEALKERIRLAKEYLV